MININEVYKFVDFISNKSQSGNITPDQFNLAAWRSQQEFINKEYRLWQETREVTDALAPFIKTSLLNPDSDGQVPYPDDYMHVSGLRALWFKDNKAIPVEVREVGEDDAGDVLMSPIVHPTLKYPCMNYYNDYMQFYPKNVPTIQFVYFRYPVKPLWAYTMVGGRSVYDPTNSINLEVRDEYQNEIIAMICNYCGIYLRDGALSQFSQQMKAEHP